jgi:hypothetical protein
VNPVFYEEKDCISETKHMAEIRSEAPVHTTGLPGDEISFILRAFTPPRRRGLRGACRPNEQMEFTQLILGRQFI